MTNTVKKIAYELLTSLEELVHLIWVYEFLNDFDDDDTDLADAVERAKLVIAKAKGER